MPKCEDLTEFNKSLTRATTPSTRERQRSSGVDQRRTGDPSTRYQETTPPTGHTLWATVKVASEPGEESSLRPGHLLTGRVFGLPVLPALEKDPANTTV